jgi:hypothetical protein
MRRPVRRRRSLTNRTAEFVSQTPPSVAFSGGLLARRRGVFDRHTSGVRKTQQMIDPLLPTARLFPGASIIKNVIYLR